MRPDAAMSSAYKVSTPDPELARFCGTARQLGMDERSSCPRRRRRAN